MSPRRCAGRVPPPSREREHHPSFSAALLDAIYHSLDADGDACEDLRRANVSPSEMPSPPPSRHRRPSTASSPSVSSARSPRPPKPPRPCRVLPHPQPPTLVLPPLPTPAPPAVESKDNSKTRRKKRTKSAPFACLLNALLCNRKPPARSSSVDARATRALPPTVVAAEPASARSILSSRASRRDSAAASGGFLTPGRRAVRFAPAVEVVVDEEEHSHGAKTAARLRDGTASASATEVSAAAEAERRVEELLRVLGVAEERERAKESSESSSDLFELESLPPAVNDTELSLSRTTVAAAGLAPPRRRVLLDEMVV